MKVLETQLKTTYTMIHDKETAQISDFVDINKVNAELDAVIAKYDIQTLPAYESTPLTSKTTSRK